MLERTTAHFEAIDVPTISPELSAKAEAVYHSMMLLKMMGHIPETTPEELRLLESGKANTVVIYAPDLTSSPLVRVTMRLSYIERDSTLVPQTRFGEVSGDRRNNISPRTITFTFGEDPVINGAINDQSGFIHSILDRLQHSSTADLRVKVSEAIQSE